MGAPLPEARPRFYKRNAFKAHSPIGRRLTRGARAQINVHNERKPQRFQAIVSGMDTASVAAERHFSPRKARALLHARAHARVERARGDPACAVCKPAGGALNQEQAAGFAGLPASVPRARKLHGQGVPDAPPPLPCRRGGVPPCGVASGRAAPTAPRARARRCSLRRRRRWRRWAWRPRAWGWPAWAGRPRCCRPRPRSRSASCAPRPVRPALGRPRVRERPWLCHTGGRLPPRGRVDEPRRCNVAHCRDE